MGAQDLELDQAVGMVSVMAPWVQNPRRDGCWCPVLGEGALGGRGQQI